MLTLALIFCFAVASALPQQKKKGTGTVVECRVR
jgi:hypothetical protein